MLKNIDPSDKSIKPFKAYKKFNLTQNDSGSGHYALKATSGSFHNFLTGSAASQSFGQYTSSRQHYGLGTYYEIPNWYWVRNMYYENDEPYRTFGNNNTQKEKRELHDRAKIFSIPRNMMGEEVKKESVRFNITTRGVTYDIRDDGNGNLYDFAHSASFAAYKSSSFDRSQGILSNGSGSQVGNIIYQHGILVITDTGSLDNAGTETHDLTYRSTRTIYEHEYVVRIQPNEFNTSFNPNVMPGRSGSITIPEGTTDMFKFLPPGDQPTNGTGSFLSFYNASDTAQGFVTHSQFLPYLTTVGLYNDNSELLAVGKLAKPVKLSKDVVTSVVVRFDV